jgi:hypothetical protein
MKGKASTFFKEEFLDRYLLDPNKVINISVGRYFKELGLFTIDIRDEDDNSWGWTWEDYLNDRNTRFVLWLLHPPKWATLVMLAVVALVICL